MVNIRIWINNLLCKMGFHNWKTPLVDNMGSLYVRHGTRECTNCGKHQSLYLKDGNAIWKGFD